MASTYTNPEYYMANFFGAYTDSDVESDHFGEQLLNIFNPTMLEIAKNSRSGTKIVYDGTSLQGIALNKYNTTSAWWLILFANGYTHESLIPKGTVLYLPDTSVLFAKKLSDSTSVNRKGLSVTIR